MSTVIVMGTIATFIAFVVGLVICKKFAFVEGMIFFGIMLLLEILTLLAPLYMNGMLDSSIRNTLPDNMTLGELVTLYSIFRQTLRLVGFLILVAGLWKRWNRRRSDETNDLIQSK